MIRDPRDLHEGDLRRGIHVAGFGSEYQIHSFLRTQRRVILERPRITLIVFRGSKLKRVHEYTDNNEIAFRASALDQACVSGMQGAHRGHEADALAVAAQAVESFT